MREGRPCSGWPVPGHRARGGRELQGSPSAQRVYCWFWKEQKETQKTEQTREGVGDVLLQGKL